VRATQIEKSRRRLACAISSPSIGAFFGRFYMQVRVKFLVLTYCWFSPDGNGIMASGGITPSRQTFPGQGAFSCLPGGGPRTVFDASTGPADGGLTSPRGD